MVTLQKLRQLALSFPETTEAPHFEKTSFKVKKKIFATYDGKNKLLCVKLSEIDQDVFSRIDKSIIYPVPNKWGKQGWTYIQLKTVKVKLFTDALTTAYCETAPASLARLLRPETN
jgi:hypothetical protein